MVEVQTLGAEQKDPRSARSPNDWTGMEQLPTGSRVRLGQGTRPKAWWTVRAVDDRFTVLTRPASKKDRGSEFTIIDNVRGLSGPCDLIGQGWDVDAEHGCEKLLRALNFHLEVVARLAAGEGSVRMTETSTEVSYRNNVPIEFLQVGS
ncbi:hypothetical protein GCM10023063_18210 [Arthrobacter methylotrophus]|uniref:Uncharacterized protein n=1 Tax=Arthrobacter methylotrophus TaxID=121291 RepID=A0ABV5UPP5_9MICC